MTERDLRAAVAGEVLAGAGADEHLLQSIVGVAQAIFVARAASIALVDEAAGELHFAAAAGEGRETVLGLRFPMTQGLAGSVVMTGEPMIVDDLTRDPRFARAVAEDSGYVPAAMMLAPLLRDERTLGVLSVLDRGRTERTTLQELDLLVRFADQAALAVDLGGAARRAARVLDDDAGPDAAALARLAGVVGALDGRRREAALRLVADLSHLLDGTAHWKAG